MATIVLTLPQVAANLESALVSFGVAAFRTTFNQAAQIAVSGVKSDMNAGLSPDGRVYVPLAHARPSGGGLPLRDTGQLLASINGRGTDEGILIGTNREDANLHQFGGVVRPVNAKYLAIPLTVVAKRAGSPRRFPGNPKWRFIPTRTGGWLMLAANPLSRSKQRQIYTRRFSKKELTAAQRRAITAIPQYVLVNEVTVPARPFLGFSQSVMDDIHKLLDERTRQLLNEAISQQRPIN